MNTCLTRTVLFLLVYSSACVSKACVPPAFQRVALEYSVPADVFYSIALAESGHTTQDFGFNVWPWALNINRESLYPESKAAAVLLIEHAISQGSDQIDVGLMQVSWRFHKTTFQSNAVYALDVGANIRAGAKIFSEFLTQADDVWQAVGFYNAGASTRASSLKAAKRYSDRVKRIYTRHVKEECSESLIAAS